MSSREDSHSEIPSKRRGLLAVVAAAAATSLFDRVLGIDGAVAQTKPEGGAAQRFSVRGLYVQACSCQVTCPCIFLSPPSLGYCAALEGWHIDSGHFEGTPLDGLNAALAVRIPEHLLKGNFRVALFVDQRANPTQRAALEAIFSGKAGGQMAGLRPLISEELPPKAIPIEFSTDGKRRRMVLSGLGEIDVTALPGAGGADVIIHDAPVSPDPKYPVTVAKSARQTLRDQGFTWEFTERNGFLSHFWFTA